MKIYLNFLIKKKGGRRNTITSYENHFIKEETEDEEEKLRMLSMKKIKRRKC